MKHTASIAALIALALAMTSMSAFAQGGGQGRGQADRPSQVDRDRSYDRASRQDRDRLQEQDFSRLKDHDIYGSQLMSANERNKYREQLQNAKTDKRRNQVQAEHRQKMLARANAQGLDLVPPGQGPIYGDSVMTVQERNEYREQLRLTESDQERAQLSAQHREEMQARALQRGVELEEVEEAE